MIYGYLRVSTLEQSSADKSSLEDQERRVRGAAMMRGVSDIEIFTDPGVSGSIPIKGRPAGKQMIDCLKKGDIIIAAKLDRLFRSASDALTTVEELQKIGVSVILADIGTDPVTENGAAKLFFSMLAAFAEFERYRIAERTADGKRGKKARGGHAGGMAPYGFKIEGKGRDAKLVPDPAESKLVAVMVDLRKHRSLRGVANELERRGFKSRRGKKFAPFQISRMCGAMTAPQVSE